MFIDDADTLSDFWQVRKNLIIQKAMKTDVAIRGSKRDEAAGPFQFCF